MFVDVFTLNKRSWHARLMKFTWGLTYKDFSHICPYFWLSLANVLLFVSGIVPIIKGVIYTCRAISDFTDYIQEWQEESRKQAFLAIAKQLEDDEKFFDQFAKKKAKSGKKFNKLGLFMRCHSTKLSNLWDKVSDSAWKIRNDEKAEQLRVEREKEQNEKLLKKQQLQFQLEEEARKRRELREEEIRLAAIARKKRINAMLKVIKPVLKSLFYLAIAAAVTGVGWLIWKLIQVMGKVPKETYKDAGNGALWLVAIIAAIIIAYFFFRWLFSRIGRWADSVEWNEETRFSRFLGKFGRFMGRFFGWIAYPFIKLWDAIIWLFVGLCKIIEITGNVIRNNCPAIDWKD